VGPGRKKRPKSACRVIGAERSIGIRPLARCRSRLTPSGWVPSFRRRSPGAVPDNPWYGQEKVTAHMRYLVMTEIPAEDVLRRAREFFAEHSRLNVVALAADHLSFSGTLGTADIRVDRDHGHTNVRVETDGVAGLDITDLTKRFLYTLGHV